MSDPLREANDALFAATLRNMTDGQVLRYLRAAERRCLCRSKVVDGKLFFEPTTTAGGSRRGRGGDV